MSKDSRTFKTDTVIKRPIKVILLLLIILATVSSLLFFGVRHCAITNNLKTIAYFEKISGILFPENMKIVCCFDNGESYTGLKAVLDADDVGSIIDKYGFKGIGGLDSSRNQVLNFADVFIGEMNSFFKSKDDKIIKSASLFFLDSCTATNRIMFVFDKTKGTFWGIIQYPDFAGDTPCGDQ